MSDLTFKAEVSGDLPPWNPGPALTQEASVTALDEQRGEVVVTDKTPLAGGQRFNRLKVTLP